MTARARRLGAAATCFFAVLAGDGVACFGGRHGLSRDGLLRALDDTAPSAQLPTLEELLALRSPAPGGTAPAPLAPGAGALARARDAAARGDIASARAAWNDAARAGGADAIEALLLRCLVENVLRHTESVLEACPAFVASAPADARAVAAVRILIRTKSGASAASTVVAKNGAAWVAACAAARGPAGSCADLAYLVGDERVAHARTPRNVHERAAAVRASGRLRAGTIEGPFDGELRSIFAADARGEALHAREGGREEKIEVLPIDDQDGALAPAVDDADGVYRLRMSVHGVGPALLYLTGGRAARVRIDDTIVVERAVDRDSPATLRSGVLLGAGPHMVEIIVYAGGSGDKLSVALLDHAGRPFASAGTAATASTARATLVSVDGGDKTLALTAVGDGSEADALQSLLLRQTIARPPTFGVDVDENQQLAAVLARQFGWSPLALAVAAEAVGDDPALSDRVSSSLAARLWREVKRSWPEHPVALIAEARDLREERPDQALAAYRALVSAQPRYAFGHRELISLALEVDLVDEALASADALLALDASRENIDAALPAIEAAGDAARAARLLDERALLDDGFGMSSTHAQRLLAQGRTREGLAALAERARHDDGTFARDERLALLAVAGPAVLSASGETEAGAAQARRAVDEALAHGPRDASLVLRRAQLVAALDGADAAKQLLVETLPLVRRDDDAVRWAEELGLPPPWQPRLALGDEVVSARRKLTTEPFPGHGSVALLDDIERIIEDDDGSLVIRHLIVELRSKEALDRFGEISMHDGRLVRLRVIKPDGSIVEPERHRGIDDVSLPQLAPGDIVERLTVERQAPSRLGGNFETRSLDGTTVPALSRRYLVSWPEAWDKKRGTALVALHGMAAPREQRIVDVEGRRRVVNVFALDNVAATSPQPFAPDGSETSTLAGYSWGVDDAFWARLRGASIARAAERSAWLDECSRLIAGSGDDEDKLRRVFAFVAQRIEPEGSPDDADAVLAGGKGRRTPLLLALLRAVGLDAEPVALQLATQADPGTLDGDSWSIIAVRVRVGARDHVALIDGNAVLDQLPAIAQGARVLDVRADAPPGTQLSALLPDDVVDLTPVKVQLDLQLSAARALSGLMVVTVPSAKADAARRGTRRATQEQLRVVMERALADSFPGVRVVEVKTPDLDAFGTPLRLGAQIEVPLPELVDGVVRFEHLFAGGAAGGLQLAAPFSSYLAVADRTLPILVGAEAERLEVQIALPPTAAFVEVPRAATFQAGPFSLEQQVHITDGVLYWRRGLAKRNARISVADWGAVRALLAAVVAQADARLSFAAPTTEGRTSPDSEKQASVQQNR
jgi:hypothetical protein